LRPERKRKEREGGGRRKGVAAYRRRRTATRLATPKADRSPTISRPGMLPLPPPPVRFVVVAPVVLPVVVA
jgi:hypothetical protein